MAKTELLEPPDELNYIHLPADTVWKIQVCWSVRSWKTLFFRTEGSMNFTKKCPYEEVRDIGEWASQVLDGYTCHHIMAVT